MPRGGAKKSHRLRNGLILTGIVIVIIVAVNSNSSNTSSSSSASSSSASTAPSAPKPSAREQYIRNHGADANRVQANVLLVALAVQQAQKSGDLNNVAQEAQTAHDNLDDIRADFAADNSGLDCSSCSLGNAGLELFTAANDLKNAMGALVAYTGDPNPATLAHFNSQYSTAKAEWNQGVRFIWAGKKNKPTI